MAAVATTKKCSKCGETKAVEEFYWANRAKGKRDSRCKACRKQYHQENREAVLARQREHYEANREEINAQQRQHYQDNREERLVQQRQYREANREAINARNRQYYADNREAVRARKREYYQANREAVLAQQRTPEARALANASQNARNATVEGKLLNKTRKLHHEFYTGKLGRVRLARGQALVGCTRKDYRGLLASQFKDGMTHDNYGQGTDKWQIDHVIPKAAFKGELEANLQVIYWWGNTQPLWGLENTAKGNKYTEEGKQALICRYQAWVTAGKPPPVL